MIQTAPIVGRRHKQAVAASGEGVEIGGGRLQALEETEEERRNLALWTDPAKLLRDILTLMYTHDFWPVDYVDVSAKLISCFGNSIRITLRRPK